ncbi:Hypothetical_protein [Hexamita inflata]|uniref:Hypothetical_protein n=1 Tax=Hexamita inflata TaxID=28002 RepID=A0AA86PPB1_9EUKA|nr:Hypothetical protein HINF_LOCUS31324 [Hexamita inflata]
MNKYIEAICARVCPEPPVDAKQTEVHKIHQILAKYFTFSERISTVHVFCTSASDLKLLFDLQSLLMTHIINREVILSADFPNHSSSDCEHARQFGFLIKRLQKCDCFVSLSENYLNKMHAAVLICREAAQSENVEFRNQEVI